MKYGKSGLQRRRSQRLLAAANVSAMVAATVLTAEAAQAQVDIDCVFTHGTSGSMAPTGSGFLITFHGMTAVVTCEQFNINGTDGVAFVQAGGGTDARILARVNDVNGTMINGPLSATGILYLVNPAGVVFGPNSRVVANGLYAAAGSIDVDQFLLGNNTQIFDTTTEGGMVEVSEGGQILAQDVVHLIGRQIANHGSISASGAFSGGGVVTLIAAQDSITIRDEPDGRVSVRIGMDDLTRDLTRPGSGVPDLSGPIGVENTGSINVNGGGGQVVLGAGNLAGLAIANSGVIEAHDGGTVQMTALGGTVYHAGTLQAADVAVTGDAIRLDADVEADTAQFNDAVYVDGAVSIRGQDGDADEVRFVSTVDGTAPGGGSDGANTLDVQSTLTKFQDTVGGQQRLNELTVGGASEVAGDILTTGDASFAGAVDANGGVQQRIDSSGGELDFDADVRKSTNGDLTLGGRSIRLGADASTLVGDLDFDGDVRFDGGALQTVDVGGGFQHAIRFSGNAIKTTDGTLRLVGRDIVFDGAGGVDQVLSAVDALDVDGRLTRTTSGDLSLTAAAIDIGGETTRTTEGDLTMNGVVTFDGDGDQRAEAGDAGALAFSGGISKTTGGDLALAGSGGVSIPGNVNVAGGGLLVEDDLALGGGSVMTAGNQNYEGDVTLGADAVFTGATVAFDENVLGGGHDLTVAGAAVFGDGSVDIDQVAGVDDLRVTGTTVVNAASVSTAGTQTYEGDVALGSDVSLAGSAVDFGGEIDGGGNDLLVNATTTTFNGAVSNVGHLETDAAGTTFVGADISVNDGVRFNDAVMLQSNVALVDGSTTGVIFGSTVDGGFALSVRTDGDAVFQGDIGSLSTLGRFETIVQGTLMLQGSILRASGDVVLNEQVSIEIPATATIGASGDLSIQSLNGSFRMGQNQKLTVLGNLDLSALGQAVLGDVNTLGDMRISASDIVLVLRDGSVVLTPAGELVPDRGLDFVAGGQFFFSMTPRAIGDGTAQFASSAASGDAAATLRGFVLRSFGGTLTPDQLQPGSGPLAGTFLDLTATGATNTSLAEAFDSAAPDADGGDALEDAILPALVRQTLAQDFAIVARDLRTEEYDGIPDGRSLYYDAPTTGMSIPVTDRISIAINRIHRKNAFRAVALWHQLTGYNPVSGHSARPPADIAADLADFWRDYAAATGADPSPAGVAASLPASLTNELTLLIAILDQIRLLGLTNTEAQVPLHAVLEQFTPAEIGERNMRAILAALR